MASDPPTYSAQKSAGKTRQEPAGAPPVHRINLHGKNPRRLSFELRIRIWLIALTAPAIVAAALLAWIEWRSVVFALTVAISLALLLALATSLLYDTIIRPLQTLANVVAALREDDFSFRARGARRGDSMGDLALEINALAGTLQRQRSAARDALTLAEQVMTSMQSPVLAFDTETRLHLINSAAERTFQLPRKRALNRLAADLNLEDLFSTSDQGLYAPQPYTPQTDATQTEAPQTEAPQTEAPGPLSANPEARWSVRRTSFRLHGIPHTLFVLSDVSAALREEERLAWQRLIRVLGHEINNSLTPIKSIAGSLRLRLPEMTGSTPDSPSDCSHSRPDLARGLAIIENRADSLNRFLQAYQQLFRLPAPRRCDTAIAPLITQVAQLELRLPVTISAGPEITLSVDPDQLQQLLINLIRNAADSALAAATAEARTPFVEITWHTLPGQVVVQILDNGTGIANSANLFVPFYTTKPEGTGIGLILAQQIAHAHKGSVTLRNRINASGCQADISLPL